MDMYSVNQKFVNVIRLSIPLGIALLPGFFLEILAPVRYFSFLFLIVGVVGNLFFPEKVLIKKKKISLKPVLSTKFKEYDMADLEVSADWRARYLILHLDRKYRLDVTTMSKDLYYQLKPYIKIKEIRKPEP